MFKLNNKTILLFLLLTLNISDFGQAHFSWEVSISNVEESDLYNCDTLGDLYHLKNVKNTNGGVLLSLQPVPSVSTAFLGCYVEIYRSSLQEVFCKIGALKAYNFIKNWLQHTQALQCFPVNFAKFLRTPFYSTPSVAASEFILTTDG